MKKTKLWLRAAMEKGATVLYHPQYVNLLTSGRTEVTRVKKNNVSSSVRLYSETDLLPCSATLLTLIIQRARNKKGVKRTPLFYFFLGFFFFLPVDGHEPKVGEKWILKFYLKMAPDVKTGMHHRYQTSFWGEQEEQIGQRYTAARDVCSAARHDSFPGNPERRHKIPSEHKTKRFDIPRHRRGRKEIIMSLTLMLRLLWLVFCFFFNLAFPFCYGLPATIIKTI